MQQKTTNLEQKRLETMYDQKQFFKAVYAPVIEEMGNLRTGEYIRIWQVNEKSNKTEIFNNIDDLVSFIASKSFGINTFFTLSTTNGQSGQMQDLKTRTVLGFDFDKKQLGDSFSHKDIINRFNKLNLRYHALIDSGNGYHAYMCIEPTADLEKVKQVTEALIKRLGADEQAGHTTQLLRVPYTFNVKNPEAVKRVNIIKLYDLNTIKRYSIDRLYKRFCCNERDKGGLTKHILAGAKIPPCITEILEKGSKEGERYNDLQKIVVALREKKKSLAEIKAIVNEWALKSNYSDNTEYRTECIYNKREYINFGCQGCKHYSECYSRRESDFNFPAEFNVLQMEETNTRFLKAPKRKGAKVMEANDLLVYGILKNHSDGLFRDEIIKDMTYRGKCRLSKNVLSKALNNLEENEFITVETIDKKKFYKIIDIRSKAELTYNISYAATYEAVKGNISAEELKLYNYMRYLHNKQQREDSKALKGNLFQFNQVDLAKDLGLTQGRISQMINNLLEEKLVSIWYRQPSQNNGFDFYIYRLNY